MDNYGRIARLLYKHAGDNAQDELITGQITQQEIADRIGSSREMVSRILKDLKFSGYIEINKKRIRLLITEHFPDIQMQRLD
jgi:CRP-like cAMP-binding protein